MAGGFFEAVLKNVFGFDLIILALGALNFYIMLKAKKAAEELVKKLNTDGVSQADMRRGKKSKAARLTDEDIIALRNKAENLYTLYVNISAVFPLFGILGTVIALIGMQGNLGGMDDGFLMALTSTFWGLVFSIVFKFLQTIVENKLDEGAREAERCLEIEVTDNEKA